MLNFIVNKLETISLWHFVWVSFVLSEILTSAMSLLLNGKITYDYLVTGGIIPLIVSSVVVYFINRLRQAEQSLIEKKVYLDSILRSSTDMAIVAVDTDLHIKYFNPVAERLLGYKAGDVIGRTAVDLHLKEGVDASRFKSGIEIAKEKGEYKFTLEQIRGGEIRFIESRLSCISDDNNNLAGFVLMLWDITNRKQAEKALYKSERFLNTIFDSIHDPFSIMDRDYRIVRVNEAYAQMKNKAVKDLIGKKCYEVLQKRGGVCDYCIVEKTFNSSDPCAKDKLIELHNGSEAWVEIYTYPIFGEEARVSHVIEYTRDITDRKKSEEDRRHLIERLKHLSRTDSLTNLLNRRAIIDRLNQELDRAKRYGSELSLMLCDMDYFKEINDTYGHTVGDSVLQVVAGTFMELLRSTDIAGRYGGDEFMVLLPETSTQDAHDIAERIRLAIQNTGLKPAAEKSINLSLSTGVTSLQPAGEDIDTLIRRVDSALYAAKGAGKNKVFMVRP